MTHHFWRCDDCSFRWRTAWGYMIDCPQCEARHVFLTLADSFWSWVKRAHAMSATPERESWE